MEVQSIITVCRNPDTPHELPGPAALLMNAARGTGWQPCVCIERVHVLVHNLYPILDNLTHV